MLCRPDESQDECEERDSIQEAHETSKACDRKRYKADFESKKDSTKAQYTGLIRNVRRIA